MPNLLVMFLTRSLFEVHLIQKREFDVQKKDSSSSSFELFVGSIMQEDVYTLR